MGEMLTSIKILPSDVEVNLEELKENVKKALPPTVKLFKVAEEPIAFGLTALIAHIITPEDESDIIERVESLLRSIRDVGEVQIVNMTRL
ncbi:MAG: elongation factor 1-beta [Candidatus Bathyarchaeia archaeon]